MSISKSSIAAIVAPVALVFILAATAAPFFLADAEWAQVSYKYVFTAGAVVLLLVRLFTPYRGTDLRLKRLHRIEAWSAIFFCAAAFFLFYSGSEGQLRDWIAFTLAGAAIQIFTSIAIPLRESKI